MKPINILLLEDEALLREGLKSLLAQESFIKNVFEAGTASEFETVMASHTVDLVLLDIRLQKCSGLEILKAARQKDSGLKVIAVTGLEGVELIINLLKAGVQGVVYKLDGYSEILKSISSVLVSDSYFPERIVRIIQTNAHRWDSVPPVLLNSLEREIVTALAQGKTTKELAVQLKMSESTTETYRVRLIKKLGVANTAALLAYAYRNGIL